jgi:hypothetical protein
VLRQHALRDEALLPPALFAALTSAPRDLPRPAWHTAAGGSRPLDLDALQTSSI